MPLLPIVGHLAARERVAKAIAAGTLPQTLLVAGPAGVGKQRFALWAAQRLMCERATSDTEPCGVCGPCHRSLGLGHPDVHWFIPIQRPKAGEPDKQVDEAAETLGDLMEARRQNPLWGPADGMWSHGIPSARLVLRRAMLTPVEAAKKVIILGDAERLVAQAGAEDAGNALLKVLEEPPADTVVILTAAEPRRLLPTVQSRAVIVRLGRLTGAEVRAFLASHAGRAGAELDDQVAAAEGSIGAALAENGSSAKHRAAAESVVEAVAAGGPEPFERALRQPPFQARGDFASMLDALAGLLADAAREGAGQTPRRPVPRALRGRALPGLVTAGERVQAAREAAQGNVNPQLLLATLSLELEEALCG